MTAIEIEKLKTKPLWTCSDVMLFLGVSRKTLDRIRAEGNLPHVSLREGGQPLFRRDDIIALLAIEKKDAS